MRAFFACICVLLLVMPLRAEQVILPATGLALCGVSSDSRSSSRLALTQYLASFTRDDLDGSSLTATLDMYGNPCSRPIINNTSTQLSHRVVGLGYATWDAMGGMLDLDLWVIGYPHLLLKESHKADGLTSNNHKAVEHSTRTRTLPLRSVLALAVVPSLILIINLLGNLSSLMTVRTSIAGTQFASKRTKIRGTAIPLVDALRIEDTDVQAIALHRVTKKYRHNGWVVTDDQSDCTRCSIDDGTSCIDVDFANARIHYVNSITVYNKIPGDPKGRTPYVDDTMVLVRYIPVGAVVTIIGKLIVSESGYRTSGNVHAFAGDERAEVRRLKWYVAASTGILTVLLTVLAFLFPSR